MNRWCPDFPGRLVDFPDYCRMVEQATFKRRGTVFAYEPMWPGADGKPRPSNCLVVAEWLERPGHGPFNVLENATFLSTGELVGLRTFAQLRTIENASALMNEHVLRANSRAESGRLSQRRDQRAARRDLGKYVLKRAPESRIGQRMVRESN